MGDVRPHVGDLLGRGVGCLECERLWRRQGAGRDQQSHPGNVSGTELGMGLPTVFTGKLFLLFLLNNYKSK